MLHPHHGLLFGYDELTSRKHFFLSRFFISPNSYISSILLLIYEWTHIFSKIQDLFNKRKRVKKYSNMYY